MTMFHWNCNYKNRYCTRDSLQARICWHTWSRKEVSWDHCLSCIPQYTPCIASTVIWLIYFWINVWINEWLHYLREWETQENLGNKINESQHFKAHIPSPKVVISLLPWIVSILNNFPKFFLVGWEPGNNTINTGVISVKRFCPCPFWAEHGQRL